MKTLLCVFAVILTTQASALVFAQTVEEINKGIRERAEAELKRQKVEGLRPPEKLNIVVTSGLTGDGYTAEEREKIKLQQQRDEDQRQRDEQAYRAFMSRYPVPTTGQQPPDPVTVTRSGCKIPGGLELPYEKSCATSGSAGKVRSVTIDGQTVWRAPR